MSYKIVTYTKRKLIYIVSSFIIAKIVPYCSHTLQTWKCTARTHITSYYQNGFRTHIASCDRTSHLRKLRPHIASHALQNRKETLTLCTVWQTTKFIREKTAPGCNEIIAVGKQTKQIILCFLTRFRLVKCVGGFFTNKSLFTKTRAFVQISW